MTMVEIKSLTGLRGVAAWYVVGYHFRSVFAEHLPLVESFLSYGFYAVDLFFVLSGFILYCTASAYFTHHHFWLSTRRFLIDRVARIYPLHFVILCLYLINPVAIVLFSDAGELGDRYAASYFFASIFLIQNWGLFDSLAWNIPAWSISSEFAAYLVFPLVSIVVFSIRRNVAVFLLILSFVLFAIFHLVMKFDSMAEDISRYGTIRCIFEFLMGLLLGRIFVLGSVGLGFFNSSLLQVLVLGAIVLGIVSGLPNFYFVPPLMCLFIYSLARDTGWLAQVLGLSLFRYLGMLSYSTYLVHFFVLDWVKFLSTTIGHFQFFVYLAVVFFASAFLFRFVEVPSRIYLKNKLSHLYVK